MTESRQLNNIGGSADGALTQEELRSGSTIMLPDPIIDLKAIGASISKALDWHYSSSVDTSSSTKYPSDPDTVYFGAGAFSFNPLLGRFIFGTSANEPSSPVFSVDQKKNITRSNASKTVLGSLDIQTADGYMLNPLGSKYPSTPFTPQKTWIKDIFSPLLEDRLLEIAFLEAIQVLLLQSLKGTKSEQIVKENKIDLGTIILDSQEIEDHVLSTARS